MKSTTSCQTMGGLVEAVLLGTMEAVLLRITRRRCAAETFAPAFL